MASSLIGDVLSPGDVVGEGIPLQGEDIRLVSVHPTDQSEPPAQEFEVIRALGTGSYAVVYLVREVLYRPVPSTDGHISIEGMELDDTLTSRPAVEYGRDFAIKCLSKVNLDGEEALDAQKAEVRFSSVLLGDDAELAIAGHHPPVFAISPKHRNPAPYVRNFIISPASPGIRSWRGSLLLFGKSPRSLRVRVSYIRTSNIVLEDTAHS